MRDTLPTTVNELVDELMYDNPPPEEKWFQRDDYDPMYRMSDLRLAAKRGLIELEINDPLETCRFRLTHKAREMIKEKHSV